MTGIILSARNTEKNNTTFLSSRRLQSVRGHWPTVTYVQNSMTRALIEVEVPGTLTIELDL